MANSTYLHFTTSGNTGTLGGTGSSAMLYAINVNTAAASAVLTVKVKDTNGATIAVIDASAAKSLTFGEGLLVNNGIFFSLSGGNADITVIGG